MSFEVKQEKNIQNPKNKRNKSNGKNINQFERKSTVNFKTQRFMQESTIKKRGLKPDEKEEMMVRRTILTIFIEKNWRIF
jgi:hypothetical protein